VAKILVVDDEVPLTEILRDNLMLGGHEVVICHDSPTALRMAIEAVPDIAIIDYQMPGKTGVQLLAELRAHKNTRQLPVAFLSGTETVRFASLVPPDPRVRFLRKPIDMEVLATTVREMLDPNSWSARP